MTAPSTEPAMGLLLELRTIPLFTALRAESLVPIATIATHVAFAAGEPIFEEGDEGDRLYVVSEGSVEIARGDEVLATLEPGQCFGEMAVVESAARSASARCLVASRLLTIAREDFDDLLRVSPVIARAVAGVLAVRLRGAFTPAATTIRNDPER